jgi:hypothetical protein
MAYKTFLANVVDLIKETPGLGHDDYARIALDRGLCGSVSKDPVFSLGSTLAKDVREDRLTGVKRLRIGGQYRYYPSDYNQGINDRRADAVLRFEVTVPDDLADDVKLLAEAKRNLTPSEALVWLAREGSKARRLDLDKLNGVQAEIERLKKQAEDVI